MSIGIGSLQRRLFTVQLVDDDGYQAVVPTPHWFGVSAGELCDLVEERFLPRRLRC